MAGFTEGEWKVRQWFESNGVAGFTLYVQEGNMELVIARDIVNEANAHLIAAAPDMYKALSQIAILLANPLTSRMEETPLLKLQRAIDDAWQISLEILAKAEGK